MRIKKKKKKILACSWKICNLKNMDNNKEFAPAPAGYKIGEERKLEFHSFQEWKELGYVVVKGQKSQKRDKSGQCLFSNLQVTQLPYFSENEDSDEFDPDLLGNPDEYGCKD